MRAKPAGGAKWEFRGATVPDWEVVKGWKGGKFCMLLKIMREIAEIGLQGILGVRRKLRTFILKCKIRMNGEARMAFPIFVWAIDAGSRA